MHYSIHDFIHPEDQEARMHLEAIPGFQLLAKTLMKCYDEQVFHGMNMAQKIRLSGKQLPEIYKFIKLPVEKLGIAEPEFYLEMNPEPNAYTYGDTRVFVTVTSGLLEYLDEDETQAVIAHECGHIACRHTLYGTMARYLIDYGLSSLGIAGKAMYPAILALLYWNRRSEFSADRAAATVMGSSAPIVETMIRLAGGSQKITGHVDVELYAKQAEEFNDELDRSWWSKLLVNIQVMRMSHPFCAVRAREIRIWCNQDKFIRLCSGSSLMGDNNALQCSECKHSIEPHWKFCRNCGKKL